MGPIPLPIKPTVLKVEYNGYPAGDIVPNLIGELSQISQATLFSKAVAGSRTWFMTSLVAVVDGRFSFTHEGYLYFLGAKQ
ncbi:hypothetical protein BDN72DRAFT_845029 [Pluteus cervinus]|uniref:Uncharacterized protein n=1 Tax=Pluteus cervinus TaxID=181527 RepID=A0ACD3AKU4_9AGAR|nr:hypothetical protein BDN72DRAFT_845029 [Pluteus cervinus]